MRKEINLFEENGYRFLKFNNSSIQSAMNLKSPDLLVLEYTKLMTFFMNFNNEFRNISVIGAGGGSIVKFIKTSLPQCHIKLIEIDKKVINIAHNFFFLPLPDDNLEIIIESGEDWIKKDINNFDAFMIDVFDDKGPIDYFNSEIFYNLVFQRLQTNGMVVVNMWSNHKKIKDFILCFHKNFYNFMILSGIKTKNVVLIGFKELINKELLFKKFKQHKKIEYDFYKSVVKAIDFWDGKKFINYKLERFYDR